MEKSLTDFNVISRIHENIRKNQEIIFQIYCGEIRKTVKYLQQLITRLE
jgi:hypothetical protein